MKAVEDSEEVFLQEKGISSCVLIL